MSRESLRQRQTRATREALLAAARRLFARQGFAATSIDQIAAACRVTKGAVYHHFSDKKSLFTAVVAGLHETVMSEVMERSIAAGGPWDRAEAGIGAFLDACLRPEFRKVALEEGPAVLGWREWRRMDEQYGLGMVRLALQDLIDAGAIEVGPVELRARVVLGALVEAAMTIADAEDSTAARVEAGAILNRLLRSFESRPA